MTTVHGSRRGVWLLVMVMLLLPVLGACSGSSDEETPALSAPPTRTPSPPTPTPEPDDTLANLEIISLREGVANFLDAAADTGALERPVVFEQYAFAPYANCFSDAFYTNTTPLEMFDFNLVSLDLDLWRSGLDAFPEAELIGEIESMFGKAVDYLPLAQPFRVCILPAPLWPTREGVLQSVFNAVPLTGDLMVIVCGDEETCLQNAGPQLAYAYAYAVQVGATTETYRTLTLGDRVIFNARADDFAHHLYPDARFDWNVSLTAAEESDLWSRMEEFLDVDYTMYPDYRKIDLFLYGKGNDLYPQFGGLVIGTNIIQAFHDNNPYVSYLELAKMPFADVLENSGYRPGSSS